MIVCTGNDKEFELYKDKINNRKVLYHIKDVFHDHWEDYKERFKDRKLLNLLFQASSITIKCWLKEKYKKFNLTPAFISVLHTYGRSLIFNPYIHIILLDGGISKTQFKNIDFFSYPSFRKRFTKVILDLLENEIGKKEFRKLKNDLMMI